MNNNQQQAKKTTKKENTIERHHTNEKFKQIRTNQHLLALMKKTISLFNKERLSLKLTKVKWSQETVKNSDATNTVLKSLLKEDSKTKHLKKQWEN